MRNLLGILFLGFVLVFNIPAQTNFAEKHFNRGTKSAKTREFQKAIKFYQQSLVEVENDKKLKSKIQYNIGVCFYQLRNFSEAEKSFLQAVNLSEYKYIQAIFSLGLTQIELGKLNSAEFNFRGVIRLNKKHGEAWFDLAMVLLERKKFENAKIGFEKSIKYKTIRLAEAENNLGVIFALQGKIDLAQTKFKKAYLKSKGQLKLAKKNLDFCREFAFSNSGLLLARLNFTDLTEKNYG